MEHFLTTEANLLAVDIASESYNFASNPRLDSASSKVLLRSSEAGSYLSELKLGRSIDEVKGACQERSSCESCGERFMYFCYDCRLPLPAIKGIIPTCKLPLRVDVIKHYKELNSKSTAVHAKIIAPDCVTIYDFPANVPAYDDDDAAVLIFPDSKAISTKDDAFHELFSSGVQIKAVFVDATWKQTKQITRHPSLMKLRTVSLDQVNTLFWRYQTGREDSSLATIEAIYFFCLDYHRQILRKEYAGEYDALLFFFKFFYSMIHELHKKPS